MDRLPRQRQAVRSNTSVCLNITAPWFAALPADRQAAAAKKMADLLESEKAGYDLGSYRDAPPGLRIWCGATVENPTWKPCCLGSTGPTARSSANSAKRPLRSLVMAKPKVLISDELSPRAVEIFSERGCDVDFKPGLKPAELRAIVGNYEGLAIRSATKVTAEVLAEPRS